MAARTARVADARLDDRLHRSARTSQHVDRRESSRLREPSRERDVPIQSERAASLTGSRSSPSWITVAISVIDPSRSAPATSSRRASSAKTLADSRRARALAGRDADLAQRRGNARQAVENEHHVEAALAQCAACANATGRRGARFLERTIARRTDDRRTIGRAARSTAAPHARARRRAQPRPRRPRSRRRCLRRRCSFPPQARRRYRYCSAASDREQRRR